MCNLSSYYPAIFVAICIHLCCKGFYPVHDPARGYVLLIRVITFPLLPSSKFYHRGSLAFSGFTAEGKLQTSSLPLTRCAAAFQRIRRIFIGRQVVPIIQLGPKLWHYKMAKDISMS